MSLYDELKKSANRDAEFSKILSRTVFDKAVITSCTFELTPLCNFRCKFCYARLSDEQVAEKGKRLFGFEDWKRYIDELAELQCVYLNITGGECTLHPDFCRVYDYAYDKGFIVSVFTNGSNITEEIFALFTSKPPARVYITMYGASEEMYRRVVGNGAYYEKVKANIRALAEARVDVIVQGTFCEENIADMERIYDFVSELGLEYRYSTKLQSYGNCTAEMLDEIVPSEELEAKLRRRIWNRQRGLDPEYDGSGIKGRFAPKERDPNACGISCNAGRNACFINAEGIMMACNTFDAFSVDTKERSVKDCFLELNEWSCNIPAIRECVGCPHIIHCITCAAAHYNDTKKLGVPSPRLCYKVTHPEDAAKEREFFDKHGYIEV